jgi:hypothetical protein
MSHVSFSRFLAAAVLILGLATPLAISAQQQTAAPTMDREVLTTFAKAYVAIAQVRDQIQAELAKTGNKTPQAQQQLRDKLREQIGHVLHQHQLTDAEFQRRTYLISTDNEQRKLFDEIIAQLTGQPVPGQLQAAAAAQAAASRPGAGAGGAAAQQGNPHIGHVVNAFGDTPNRQGLLPVALAEARVAAQHAALAARNTSNLDAMKQHAGHVLHAVDPTAAASGPGQGYGVKKAAAAVATHIELAARAPGASQAVSTHAMHIATAARNTVQRADKISALVKQIQAATTAEEAATLVHQLVPLTEQLVGGADANADGRIGWQEGEGGLQHVEEHVNLLLRAQGGQ